MMKMNIKHKIESYNILDLNKLIKSSYKKNNAPKTNKSKV
jgi:hypothetical protein